MLICYAGVLFVAIALPLALRRSNELEDDAAIPPVINDVQPGTSWQSTMISPLAKDRTEYFEMWKRHHADPMNLPVPIPPHHSSNEADDSFD